MHREGLLAVMVCLFVWILVLLARLRMHRTDLRSNQGFWEGESRVWQQNVLSPRNYDAGGKRLLRWMFVALALWAASLASFLLLRSPAA